jgi:hypothetical protein
VREDDSESDADGKNVDHGEYPAAHVRRVNEAAHMPKEDSGYADLEPPSAGNALAETQVRGPVCVGTEPSMNGASNSTRDGIGFLSSAYDRLQPAGDVLHTGPADLAIISAMKIAIFAVLVPLLASCASSGLYNMSDAWCADHPSASLARCPQKDADRRVVANDSAHGADGEAAPKD